MRSRRIHIEHAEQEDPQRPAGNGEYARMREAYGLQPDSAAEADDWSSAEEFRP